MGRPFTKENGLFTNILVIYGLEDCSKSWSLKQNLPQFFIPVCHFLISTSLTNSGSSLSRITGENSLLGAGPRLASWFLRSLACFLARAFWLLMKSLPYKATLVWGSTDSGTGSRSSSWESSAGEDKHREREGEGEEGHLSLSPLMMPCGLFL